MNTEMAIPDGYMKNSRGGFDPIEMVKDIDKLRDDLVNRIVTESLILSETLQKAKRNFFTDIEAFVKLSAEQYGVFVGGKKGNISFLSYDGEYKILLAVSESIVFDERLQIAKELIDDCIQDWVDGSRTEIQALINDAFYVGKAGKLNKERILGLRRLDIKDERWKKAMEAISDSIQVSESKSYIRIYKRNKENHDKYDLVDLNIAAL